MAVSLSLSVLGEFDTVTLGNHHGGLVVLQVANHNR
jgi:hypothetical protein